MGNIGETIKRFFTNRNTITILGVIIGVIVLWGFYNWRVKQATNPIQVPYAKQTITATTEISEDMIGYIEVNSKFLNNAKIITNAGQLIGKYITTGTSIPEGGLFYQDQVVEKDSLPNTVFENIPAGYTIFSLSVDLHSTYANSIYPGTRIDIYMKAPDDSGKIMYGMLINSIEVLAVRDSNGSNVFDQSPPSSPSELLFAVPDEMYKLLTRATYLSSVELVPVPRNKTYTAEAGETRYGSNELKNYIESKTISIEDTIVSSGNNSATESTTEQTPIEQQTNE